MCADKQISYSEWGDLILGDKNVYSSENLRKSFYFVNKLIDKLDDECDFTDNEVLNEINERKRELEQAKVQFRDERNAWQKQNRISARNDANIGYLSEIIQQKGIENFDNHSIPIINNNDNDLAVLLSDLHIGTECSSTFGEFNTDIAKERLNKYLNEVIKIQKRHNSKNAYICVLGDTISGLIHLTVQITNRENIIEQVKVASELIARFCHKVSEHFENVFVSSVSGNHSRISATGSKDDALKADRLDDLVMYIVQGFLSHIQNIHFTENKLDSTIDYVSIRKQNYLLVHGDYDRITESGMFRLSSLVGFMPDGVFIGHKHTPEYHEINGIKVIQSGSLVGGGSDDYTIEKRLYGKPSQTICVCTDTGIDCIYNVQLS